MNTWIFFVWGKVHKILISFLCFLMHPGFSCWGAFFFFWWGGVWSLTRSRKHQDQYYWTRNIFSKMFTLFTKQMRMKSFRIRQDEVSHLFLWLWISKEERRGEREGQGEERVRKNRRKIRKEAKKKEGKGVRRKGGKKERRKKEGRERATCRIWLQGKGVLRC